MLTKLETSGKAENQEKIKVCGSKVQIDLRWGKDNGSNKDEVQNKQGVEIKEEPI